MVVDCSRPKDLLVNNSTDSVELKCSYKSSGNVTDMLQEGDYIGTLDIKDAYRAVKQRLPLRVRVTLLACHRVHFLSFVAPLMRTR